MMRTAVLICVGVFVLSACVPESESASQPIESAPSEAQASEAGGVSVEAPMTWGERFAEDQFTPSFSAVHQLRTYTLAEASAESEATETSTLLFVRMRPSAITLGEPIEVGSTLTGTLDGADERELAHVRNVDGDRYWIDTRYAVLGGQLAVVVAEETIVYERPSVLNPSAQVLPRGTILVRDPAQSTADFFAVVGWDDAAGAGFSDVFIRAGDASTRESDVQVALLIKLASFSDSDVRKQAFLSTAIDQSFADSEFRSEATEAWRELTGEGAPEEEMMSAHDSEEGGETVEADGMLRAFADRMNEANAMESAAAEEDAAQQPAD